MRSRFSLTRESYTPKGATKVSDKQSDAVAYLYTNTRGKPHAVVFFGKQAKPVLNFYYRSEESRAKSVKNAFENRRSHLARVAAARKERTDYVNDYKVGQILRTCWGYEQTNVEYFEVTEVKGMFVVVREIAQERVETHHMQGSCVPLPGKYLTPRYDGDDRGLPLRRLAQKHGIKIDDVRYAYPVSTQKVGGVDVISPASWSSYH